LRRLHVGEHLSCSFICIIFFSSLSPFTDGSQRRSNPSDGSRKNKKTSLAVFFKSCFLVTRWRFYDLPRFISPAFFFPGTRRLPSRGSFPLSAREGSAGKVLSRGTSSLNLRHTRNRGNDPPPLSGVITVITLNRRLRRMEIVFHLKCGDDA